MAEAERGLALPEHDGEVEIAAQEWSWKPGPRAARVYIRYPGGSLAHVGPRTGIMLSLHNWGGVGWGGAPNPEQLAHRYDVVAASVDYLQSGPYDGAADPPYDFGCLQAVDALRALRFVFHGLEEAGKPFARGRLYATGGSGGSNVALMANKLAPRTFACVVDICGMAKLNDDIAYNLPGGSKLNAGYSADAASPRYLSPSAQALRFVGNPEHLAVMRALGAEARIVSVHGASDATCPVDDKREMTANMRAAGLLVDAHIVTDADVDGTVLAETGHALGDRTRIVFRYADRYLMPDSPEAAVRRGSTDSERRETVRYDEWAVGYEGGLIDGPELRVELQGN